MIHAASEKPKDDLPYEEMSEVRAHTVSRSKKCLSLAPQCYYMWCLFVCHPGRKDHL